MAADFDFARGRPGDTSRRVAGVAQYLEAVIVDDGCLFVRRTRWRRLESHGLGRAVVVVVTQVLLFLSHLEAK